MASLAQTLASIRGEGWKVTKQKNGTWRVRQADVDYYFDRAQLFTFVGKTEGPADPAPEDKHLRGATCADRPYMAERVLRIIERHPRAVSHLEVIDELVEHAGPLFAREALNRQAIEFAIDQDVPF